MDVRVTNQETTVMTGEISEYLLRPRLWIPETDYPDYCEWVKRSTRELEQGVKRSMLALARTSIYGALVYQRDKEDPEVLELKNLSIRPHFSGRRLASFMLRNVEIEGMQEFPGVTRATVDTKVENKEVIEFFLSQGYTIADIEDLYRLGTGEDVVLTKALISEN